MIEKGVLVYFHFVKYPVTKEAFSKFGIKKSQGIRDASIIWFDGNARQEDLFIVQPWQRCNKIPSMDFLCYKSTTFQILNHMQMLHPKVFTFYPKTFILPGKFADFQHEHIKLTNRRNQEKVTWIVKPRNGCCGMGIRLIQSPLEIADDKENVVVQYYVSPYLLNGFKFDFRLYVLISTLSPYTVFIYKDGLARFCTEKYNPVSKENIHDKFSHITNTAINSTNTNSVDMVYTRFFSEVLAEIENANPNSSKIWDKIKQTATLAMAGIYQSMVTNVLNYQTKRKVQDINRYQYSNSIDPNAKCIPTLRKFFHLVGLDIIITDDLQPVLLEINDRPSLSATFDVEVQLKPQLVQDIFTAVTLDGSPPKPENVSKNWDRLLPLSDNNDLTNTIDSILSSSKEELKPRLMMTRPIRCRAARVFD